MADIDRLKAMNDLDVEYFKDSLETDMLDLISLLQQDLDRLNNSIDLNNIEHIYKMALNIHMNYARLKICESYNYDLNSSTAGE